MGTGVEVIHGRLDTIGNRRLLGRVMFYVDDG